MNTPGVGGAGSEWPTSSGVFYAGGGGAGGYLVNGANGGTGGGGKGGNAAANGTAGGTNTGGGGGGGGVSSIATGTGGAGGKGVVIVRYPNSEPDATSTTGSPTYANTGGFKSYTFTDTGSITW